MNDRENREAVRRRATEAMALLFVTQFIWLDVAFFGVQTWWRRDGSLGAAAASVALWTMLSFLVRSSRAGRVVVALLAATLGVLQVFVFRIVHVPLDVQVAEAARHSFGIIRSVVVTALPAFLLAVGLVFVLELAWMASAARLMATLLNHDVRRERAGIAASVFLTGSFFIMPPFRGGTPDLRALASLSVLRREAPVKKAGAVSVPALYSTKASVPDVLIILTESVRASDYVLHGPDPTAPHTFEALPRRFDLAELRAVSSYTAVSLSALITGLSQDAPREDVLAAPNLFDFAHAMGANVAFYSAQSRETFETKDVRAAVDRFFSLETIAGHDIDDDAEWVKQPLDRMTVDRFIDELDARPHPAVTMLQLYGTHAPYYFEDENARFTPWSRQVAWAEMPQLRNAYRNAIATQDAQVARAVKAFVNRNQGRPWLIVFTSDHGEAFGEHAAIHHGQNLYDEQLHVPGWFAVGGGALSSDDERYLEGHRADFVTHLDILPTLLDAFGVLENFSVAPYRARWKGQSLLRPKSASVVIPITNCTPMFPCPVNTWGVMSEDLKLMSQAWDGEWRCMSLVGTEHELALSEPRCAALVEASRHFFERRPNGTPNRR